MLQNISIGLFIDGGYYEKVYLEAQNQGYVLHISKLLKFCVKYLSDFYHLEEDDCQITEKHYFRGHYNVDDAITYKRLEKDRRFEDTLIEQDVVFHYKHVQCIKNEYGVDVEREKGIDVWFALETYELSIVRDLDIVVIFTGDGDHEMLLNKIKALKKKAILLTWYLSPQTNFSKHLSEDATHHIKLRKLLSENSDYLPFFEKVRFEH